MVNDAPDLLLVFWIEGAERQNLVVHYAVEALPIVVPEDWNCLTFVVDGLYVVLPLQLHGLWTDFSKEVLELAKTLEQRAFLPVVSVL